MPARFGIGAKLNAAFGALAAVTVLVLLAGFLAGRSVTEQIRRAEAVRAPASLTSAQAQASLMRMQLHFRGYLVLGDPHDIEQFRAYRREFENALVALRTQASAWPADEAAQLDQLAHEYELWVRLPPQLFELHDNPLRNRPALRLARLEVQPRKAETLSRIDTLIEIQRTHAVAPADRALLADLVGLRASFEALTTNLMAYAASGEPSFRLAYEPLLSAHATLWRAIVAKRAALDQKQRAHLDAIGTRSAEIGALALQIVATVGGARASEDLYLYRTEAAPRALELLRLTEALTRHQQAALQDDLGHAGDSLRRARLPALLGGFAAVVLAVALALLSHRVIVGPLRRLTAVAEQVAGGDLSARADVESGDEIGRLAQTINTRLRKEDLQQLMASVSDALWSAEVAPDRSFVYRYHSPVVERITGLPAEHFLASPQRWLDLVHPDDRQDVARGLERVTSGAADRADAEYRIVRPDGALLWVRDSVRATPSGDGRIALNGVISDISARKAAEAALRDSETRFRSLTALSSDWYWRQDRELRFTYLSSEVQELAGYSAASSIGKTRWELNDVTPLSSSWSAHRAVLDARQPFRDFEYSRPDPDGKPRYISASGAPIFDEHGRFEGYQGIGRNITERKRIEEELRARQEMLDLAQKAARTVAIDWRIDAPDGERRWSAALDALFGLAAGESLGAGRSWQQVVHPDDWPALCAAVDRASETGEVAAEYRVVAHPDGALRWLQTKGKMLFDADGQPRRMIGFLLDITDRKAAQDELLRLELQLRQSQRLEAMGTLAGGIAHDFNNILGAILGYGEMALRDAARGSRLRRDLDSIMAAGERGRALVERILAFSRSSVGERIAVPVEAVVREALDLIAANLPDAVAIVSRLNAGRAAMLGDPTQVHQVLMNLATNAVQAMAGGGTLCVSLHLERLDAQRVATTGSVGAGEYIVLEVADDGSGIPGEITERIFDPFFTTKEVGVGTGLGLSLVHGIVSELGGAIDVDSTPGQGSVFTVYLPRTGDADEARQSQAAAVPRGDRQQILVVDDEEPLVRLTSENLADWGYVPVGFTSSKAALEAFRAEPQRFAAVVSDERMPGLSGTALLRAIHALRPELPTLLVSGYVGAELTSRASEAGVGGLLKKPLSMRDLAAALARLLGTPANRLPAA